MPAETTDAEPDRNARFVAAAVLRRQAAISTAEADRLAAVAKNMGDFDVWGSRVERSARFAVQGRRLSEVADWLSREAAPWPTPPQTTRSMWHQMLDAQAEIRGGIGLDHHDCDKHGHVFDKGECMACDGKDSGDE